MAALVHALTARLRLLAQVWLALAIIAPPAIAQQTVTLLRQDRQTIAVTAFMPDPGPCRGIAIVSPGAGGSERGYAYLGAALSALGYLTTVVGHPESGPQAVRERARARGLRDGLAALINDPAPYRARFQDIAAAREWARSRCPGGESVLVGHSMGAATAMIEAGARNKLGLVGDPSFDLYVMLSPQGAGSIFPTDAWTGLSRPILTLTGTRDEELGGGPWQTRTEPYRGMPPGCKWLAVVTDATHLQFAGLGASGPVEAVVSRLIGAFIAAAGRKDCTPPRSDALVSIESK